MSQNLINELGNKYGFLSPIELTKDKNNRTAWLCKCDCGNTKIVRGSDLRKGKITSCGWDCPLRKKRNGAFINEIGNKYGLLTVLYENGRTNAGKVIWHCKCDCGNECDVCGSDLRSGLQQSCGCLCSKGENLIKELLLSLKINFKQQYSFNNLLGYNNGKLRFDFALFDKDNNLIGLIEFQGEQHFYPIKAFGGEKTFMERKFNDKQKIEYCNNNNISLLLLRKTDNIELELNNYISKIFNEVWD